MSDFSGRVVLVTGGASGIGAATAAAFAKAGARVMIADLDAKAGRRRAADFGGKRMRAAFVRADVGKPAQVTKMVRATVAKWGRLDVLVNNAGIGSGAGFLDRPRSHWDRVLAVNLTAAYLGAQTAAPHLIKARGAIVNIASTRALMSEADTEPYSATKGGLVALTHSLAVTLSGKVRVNSVSPGWIDTGEWHYGGRRGSWTKEDHAQHPAGRVGRPEDIAQACLYLCSEKAGFITGQNLIVDGGMTIRMIYAE